MIILDQIKRIFNRNPRNSILRDSYITSDLSIGCLKYSEIIYRNIEQIITSLINDVELYRTSKKTDALEFSYFKRFIDNDGQFILDRLFDMGYVVIKLPKNSSVMVSGYKILDPNDYNIITTEGTQFKVVPIHYKEDEIYVIKSDTFREIGISDKQLLYPVLKYLDNILNASNTLTERMGVCVIASPKNLTSSPTSIILTEDDKKELEKEMSEQYGALKSQKQVMLLPREMTFEQVNLAGIDQKLEEKLKIAVEIIADKLRVPANKVALIDAESNKALANGSELTAGDLMLYKNFERLLDRSIMRMADDLGLKLDYNIYNKPVDNQGEVING